MHNFFLSYFTALWICEVCKILTLRPASKQNKHEWMSVESWKCVKMFFHQRSSSSDERPKATTTNYFLLPLYYSALCVWLSNRTNFAFLELVRRWVSSWVDGFRGSGKKLKVESWISSYCNFSEFVYICRIFFRKNKWWFFLVKKKYKKLNLVWHADLIVKVWGWACRILKNFL